MAHIGDLVPKSGIYTEPGVIVEKNNDGSVRVDTEPMSVNKFHRYTNTTGLTEEEKNKFNEILDDIYANSGDDVQKINDIQKQIDQMKTDPASKNIVQYLHNQQAFLIRATKRLPREYRWDEAQIKI